MPGLVLGEVSSCSNPILPFFYQSYGVLTNIFALRYSVYPVGSTSLITSGTMNMDPCEDGGTNKAAGYYVLPLDPATLEMEPGSYEVVFSYTVADGGDEEEYSYSFEILEGSTFRTSRAYRAYISSSTGILDGFSLAQRQIAVHEASKLVEFLTGREFFPRYMDYLHSMPDSGPNIWLFQPVIGINEVSVTTSGAVAGTAYDYPLDLSSLRVYNRHLSGILSPDDRFNPRITLELVDTLDRFFLSGALPKGELNVKVTGIFGYTDPDGSSTGSTPVPLQDVVASLAYRKLVDPLASDVTLWDPARIRKAKTRDQELQLATTTSAENSSMTGNHRLDSILAQYLRPPYVGAV